MRQVKEVRVTVEFDNGETFTVIDRPLPVAFTDDNRYLGQEFSRGMDGCQIAGHRIIEGYFPGQVLKADRDVNAKIDALHGPGASAALDKALADGSVFND